MAVEIIILAFHSGEPAHRITIAKHTVDHGADNGLKMRHIEPATTAQVIEDGAHRALRLSKGCRGQRQFGLERDWILDGNVIHERRRVCRQFLERIGRLGGAGCDTRFARRQSLAID